MMLVSLEAGLSRALAWLAFMIVLAGLAHGATITVIPGESIQAAINSSNPGDTILVESGTYRENVKVTKAVVLKGVGMPVADAMGSGSEITLSEDGIWLEEFVATNASSSGILAISNGNTIAANNASYNKWSGIYLLNSHNALSGNNAATTKDLASAS